MLKYLLNELRPITMDSIPNALTPMVQGGTMCPHFFQVAISPWRKGSGGQKFLDFSWFIIIKFQKINPRIQATFKSTALLGLRVVKLIYNAENKIIRLLPAFLLWFICWSESAVLHNWSLMFKNSDYVFQENGYKVKQETGA